MSRKVEMVRMAPDQSFTAVTDRERSAAEVFGSATKFQKVDKATVDKALEGKTTKFLSEAELQKNKEQHGGSLEDGTFSGMSLTQAIIAQREEKEQKFQDGWKTMKQGKNRPLEEDEAEFLKGLAKEEAMKQRRKKEEEKKVIERMEEIQKSSTPLATSSILANVAPKPRPALKRHISVIKRSPAASKAPDSTARADSSAENKDAASKPAPAAKTSENAAGTAPASAAPVAAVATAGLGLVSGYDSSDSGED